MSLAQKLVFPICFCSWLLINWYVINTDTSFDSSAAAETRREYRMDFLELFKNLSPIPRKSPWQPLQRRWRDGFWRSTFKPSVILLFFVSQDIFLWAWSWLVTAELSVFIVPAPNWLKSKAKAGVYTKSARHLNSNPFVISNHTWFCVSYASKFISSSIKCPSSSHTTPKCHHFMA